MVGCSSGAPAALMKLVSLSRPLSGHGFCSLASKQNWPGWFTRSFGPRLGMKQRGRRIILVALQAQQWGQFAESLSCNYIAIGGPWIKGLSIWWSVLGPRRWRWLYLWLLQQPGWVFHLVNVSKANPPHLNIAKGFTEACALGCLWNFSLQLEGLIPIMWPSCLGIATNFLTLQF